MLATKGNTSRSGHRLPLCQKSQRIRHAQGAKDAGDDVVQNAQRVRTGWFCNTVNATGLRNLGVRERHIHLEVHSSVHTAKQKSSLLEGGHC